MCLVVQLHQTLQLRSLYKVEPTNQRSTTINLLMKTNHSPEERKSLLDNAAVGEEPRYPGHLEDGLPNRAQSRLQVSQISSFWKRLQNIVGKDQLICNTENCRRKAGWKFLQVLF